MTTPLRKGFSSDNVGPVSSALRQAVIDANRDDVHCDSVAHIQTDECGALGPFTFAPSWSHCLARVGSCSSTGCARASMAAGRSASNHGLPTAIGMISKGYGRFPGRGARGRRSRSRCVLVQRHGPASSMRWSHAGCSPRECTTLCRHRRALAQRHQETPWRRKRASSSHIFTIVCVRHSVHAHTPTMSTIHDPQHLVAGMSKGTRTW